MSTVYANIAELVTNDATLGDGSPLGIVTDAAIVVENGRVAWVGPRAEAPDADDRIDLAGARSSPDSSTAMRIWCSPVTARRSSPRGWRANPTTVAASPPQWPRRGRRPTTQLAANVGRLADELRRGGVTTFETKSGYGLSHARRSAVVAGGRRVHPETTFLGAHVVPAEYRDDREAYVRLVAGDMLAACRPHARWVDVFCEHSAFDVDETRIILEAGIAAGLTPRLHAGQLGPGEGIRLGVELGAASIDHCTYATDLDIEALAAARATTVATLLPGAEFSTRAQYPDARRFIDAGVTVALATDCNPGSSYTTSMAFCIAVAVRDMKFTPAEALWAATAGGAAALRRDDVGALSVGKRADFVRLDAPSYIHLAYRPGVPLIAAVHSQTTAQHIGH